MRKNSYFCDRCGCQIEDCGAKIVPHYFDFDTEDLTVPINKDMEIRHYCMDCTMEALEFLEAKIQHRKRRRKAKRNCWMLERSWHCIMPDGTMPRSQMNLV